MHRDPPSLDSCVCYSNPFNTWAICRSYLGASVPDRTPHGHLGPLQFCTHPDAWVPYGTHPLDPWLPYRSALCPDTCIPYISSHPHWMLGFLRVPSRRHPTHPSPAPVCVPQFPLWPQGLRDPSHFPALLLYWPQLGPMGKDPGGGVGQRARSSRRVGGSQASRRPHSPLQAPQGH